MMPEEIKERIVKRIKLQYADRKRIENEKYEESLKAFNERMRNIVTMENSPGANVTCGVCGTQFYLFTEKQAEDYCTETGDSTVGGICPKCDCVYGKMYEF